MMVCVTGGTGFLGAHSVAAILRAGHRVRLLVRDASAVDRALTPLGVDPGAVDVKVGSVTDELAVASAVRGCDAVLHAAAVYSFDSRRRSDMRDTNVRGTEVVLDAARHAGVGKILYVSTMVALCPGDGRVIRADSPVGTAREPYMASKAAAERVAREHQRQGAPVLITYPAALLGPHDPKMGDQNTRLRNAVRGLMPIWPRGGFPVGDVRDTAELHARLLGAGPDVGNRHFGPSHYLSTRDYMRAVRQVTGRRLRAVFLPAKAMLPIGALTSVVQRIWPWHIPAEYGAIYICACDVRADQEPGTPLVQARPVVETMRDTVIWLTRP